MGEGLLRGGDPDEPGPGLADHRVQAGDRGLGGVPLGRLRGQAVRQPLVADFRGLTPLIQYEGTVMMPAVTALLAPPGARVHRARALPPFPSAMSMIFTRSRAASNPEP